MNSLSVCQDQIFVVADAGLEQASRCLQLTKLLRQGRDVIFFQLLDQIHRIIQGVLQERFELGVKVFFSQVDMVLHVPLGECQVGLTRSASEFSDNRTWSKKPSNAVDTNSALVCEMVSLEAISDWISSNSTILEAPFWTILNEVSISGS